MHDYFWIDKAQLQKCILLYMLYKMELVYFLNYNFILFQAHHADLSMMEKLDQIPEWK